MMRVTIAGGVGEHGRNCFLVESRELSFLVDCGVMAGAAMPWPRLTDDQIRPLRYVFLTHSHADHAGALGWLAEHGFSGQIVASGATLMQLGKLPAPALTLEDFPSGNGIALYWGRAGHCAGSVWYSFALTDGLLFFSGDYMEESLIYNVDPVRDTVADLAVIDSAYGPEARTPIAMRREFVEAVRPFAEAGQPVLFPVPRYGRGPEILYLLARRWPAAPLYGDETFRRQLNALAADPCWVQPAARSFLRSVTVQPLPDVPPREGFAFVSDPRLEAPETEALARQVAGQGGVLLTGAAEEGSPAAALLREGLARFARIPVHGTSREYLFLRRHNRFGRSLPYHSEAWPCRDRTILL